MPSYAVTGASGHVGRYAVHQILARGVPPSGVVAVVRTTAKNVVTPPVTPDAPQAHRTAAELF
jgi:uncharacterized protein YbjT (DUF2867 family)